MSCLKMYSGLEFLFLIRAGRRTRLHLSNERIFLMSRTNNFNHAKHLLCGDAAQINSLIRRQSFHLFPLLAVPVPVPAGHRPIGTCQPAEELEGGRREGSVGGRWSVLWQMSPRWTNKSSLLLINVPLRPTNAAAYLSIINVPAVVKCAICISDARTHSHTHLHVESLKQIWSWKSN